MRREILFSVALVLLLCSCTLAVGSVRWTNWAIWPVRPVSIEPRWAYQGTSNQHQGLIGFQVAYAPYGPSSIWQITKARGEQSQDVTDTAIQQHQNGSILVGQIAGILGAGKAGGIQHFHAHQHQEASSAVGQAIQTSYIGVTQISNVVGAAGSTAIAGGKVVVSTSQTQYMN